MDFRIIVLPSAESDLAEHFETIARDSFERACQWIDTAWSKIFSLREMPNRFAIIDESQELGEPLRSILHHSHRIIYKVDESTQTIAIVRVWHQARSALRNSDLN